MSFLAGSRALCLQPALALCTGALRLRLRSAPALCVQRLLLRLSSALVLEIQMLMTLQQATTLCACAPRRLRRQEQQGLRRRLQRLQRQRVVGEREQREHDAHDLDEGHTAFPLHVAVRRGRRTAAPDSWPRAAGRHGRRNLLWRNVASGILPTCRQRYLETWAAWTTASYMARARRRWATARRRRRHHQEQQGLRRCPHRRREAGEREQREHDAQDARDAEQQRLR